MNETEFTKWLGDSARRCLVMGVLNLTPDSFSDGGRYRSVEAAVEEAYRMCEAGAEVIDIGGESTRPGSQRVPAAEQIKRILPVLKAIEGRIGAVLSVDTTRAEVARAALDAGAAIINDISAGQEEAALLEIVARRGAAVILMHMKGEPATMQANPAYENVVEEVRAFLQARMEVAEGLGVPRARILLDPGIGFGKGAEHNLELLRELRRFGETKRPIVVGLSRKAFIGRITGKTDPAQRVFGTAGGVAWSVANGAAVVRVHDVEPMAQVVRVVEAIQAGRIEG